MWHQIMKKPLSLVSGLLMLIGLAAVACAGGVSQKAYDAAAAEAKAKAQEVAQLQKQLSSTAPTNVVQVGQLQPAPAAAQPTGWDTAESIRGGLRVYATYDSNGPAAWDPVAHPLVYFTSEGRGYSHRPSANNLLAGLQIIDATTKKVVTSARFDLGVKDQGTPHGLGISPDGKWIYVPTSEGTTSSNSATAGQARLLIVNARTLKLDMILTNPNRGFHHVKSFKDWLGRDRVLVETQHVNGSRFILDPNDNHRVVRAVTPADVGPQGHPYSTVDPSGKFLYLSIASEETREAEFPSAGIAKVNLETGAVRIIPNVGNWPIGMAHTSDGKYTYVADGTGSKVYKIDNATNKIAGHTSAGVAGPYGLALNWDETELWVVGKGEGSHNTGGVLGVIDTRIFSPTRAFNQPVNIGGAIIDHATLHPDPNANELWVSSAGTWETIVVDLTKREVKARIPSPNGGDTHSGGFVRYKADFTGEVLSDHDGPEAAMRALIKANAAKAAAAK